MFHKKVLNFFSYININKYLIVDQLSDLYNSYQKIKLDQVLDESEVTNHFQHNLF